MKVYLINLDKDIERLAAADAQLKRLGVDYERVSAVYAKELPQEELDGAVNKFRWWCAMGREARVGEIGCAMSHYMIYRKIIAEKIPIACILEDDVILDDRFPEVLKNIEAKYDLDEPSVVLLSDHTKREGVSAGAETGFALECSRRDMFAEGYVLGGICSRHLLASNWPMQVPCDHWGRWVKTRMIKLYHARPTVCSQDQSQYESETAGVGFFDVKNLKVVPLAFHKLKRLIGKIIDGVLLEVDAFAKKGV